MRRVGGWLLCLAVTVAACSRASGTTSSAKNGLTIAVIDGGVADAGAAECVQDSDCVVAPWPIDDAPCCDAPYAMVQSKVAVEARAALRRSPACLAFDCTTVASRFGGPPPAPPARCYFQPRCHDARCGNSC